MPRIKFVQTHARNRGSNESAASISVGCDLLAREARKCQRNCVTESTPKKPMRPATSEGSRDFNERFGPSTDNDSFGHAHSVSPREGDEDGDDDLEGDGLDQDDSEEDVLPRRKSTRGVMSEPELERSFKAITQADDPKEQRQLTRRRLWQVYFVLFVLAVLYSAGRQYYVYSIAPQQPLPWVPLAAEELSAQLDKGRRMLVFVLPANANETQKRLRDQLETPDFRQIRAATMIGTVQYEWVNAPTIPASETAAIRSNGAAEKEAGNPLTKFSNIKLPTAPFFLLTWDSEQVAVFPAEDLDAQYVAQTLREFYYGRKTMVQDPTTVRDVVEQ
jgi:hypothetical protein